MHSSGRRSVKQKSVIMVACALLGLIAIYMATPVSCQRDGSDDDFDDSGFDDSGYNSPQSHEAEGSQHNPSNYSPANEEDLDDDDDVDETQHSPQVATDDGGDSQAQQEDESVRIDAIGGPQRFYDSANPMLLAASVTRPSQLSNDPLAKQSTVNNENDIEDVNSARLQASQLSRSKRSLGIGGLIRKKRYSKKYIGPVYTYVKTDKHARYKWGVKHKVGKHYG